MLDAGALEEERSRKDERRKGGFRRGGRGESVRVCISVTIPACKESSSFKNRKVLVGSGGMMEGGRKVEEQQQ